MLFRSNQHHLRSTFSFGGVLMAIRKPGRHSGEWFFEDVLEYEVTEPGSTTPTQFWSLKIKYFEEPPTQQSETFNNEVASIEYEVQGKLITIVDWNNYNWRDEWPIRLGVNYLCNCLYRPGHQFLFRTVKDPIAFWQSERFLPIGGHLDPFLQRTPQWVP